MPWTCQIDWRAKQPSQVACFSEDLKCWGAWDTTCGYKAKDLTKSIARIAWKEEALDDLPLNRWERVIVNETNIGTVSKATLGNFWETGWSAYGLFRAHRYHLELNLTFSFFAITCVLVLWVQHMRPLLVRIQSRQVSFMPRAGQTVLFSLACFAYCQKLQLYIFCRFSSFNCIPHKTPSKREAVWSWLRFVFIW